MTDPQHTWVLPDGTWTPDQGEFHDKWDYYLDYLRDKGFRVISYCPNVTVTLPGEMQTVSLPIWVIDTLMETDQ